MSDRYALTDDQIDVLAPTIADRIASEYQLQHYRLRLASLVEDCLSGTPYLWDEPRRPKDGGAR